MLYQGRLLSKSQPSLKGGNTVELRVRHTGTAATGDVAFMDAGGREGPGIVETIADHGALSTTVSFDRFLSV